MSSPFLKWVVFGTGDIAQKFITSIDQIPNHKVVGIVTRDLKKGDNFLRQFKIDAKLITDKNQLSEIDFNSTYIATPHAIHKQEILLTLAMNKHILAEKPITTKLKDFDEIKKAHELSQSFLMEALWTIFQPATKKLREIIKEHGNPKHVECSLGFFGTKERLFDQSLGGGSLLDVGVYAVSIFRHLFGEPKNYSGKCEMKNNIDLSCSGTFFYSDFEATFNISIDKPHTNEFILDYGYFKIVSKAPWWHGSEIIQISDSKISTSIYKEQKDSFTYQIFEVERCIANNEKESEFFPLDESRKNLIIIENILENPGDK